MIHVISDYSSSFYFVKRSPDLIWYRGADCAVKWGPLKKKIEERKWGPLGTIIAWNEAPVCFTQYQPAGPGQEAQINCT